MNTEITECPPIDDMHDDWEAEQGYWDPMADAGKYADFIETCAL